MPGCFETLRRYREARSGTAGRREYILILQLLRDFPVDEVQRAMEKAREYHSVTFASIKMLILSCREPSCSAVRLSAGRLAGLPKVHIAGADPSCYRALLAGGCRMSGGDLSVLLSHHLKALRLPVFLREYHEGDRTVRQGDA